MSFQNFGRLPIIDQTAPLYTYSVVENPFGDEPECAGFYVSVFSAITRGHDLLPVWYPTAEAAHIGLLAELGLDANGEPVA